LTFLEGIFTYIRCPPNTLRNFTPPLVKFSGIFNPIVHLKINFEIFIGSLSILVKSGTLLTKTTSDGKRALSFCPFLFNALFWLVGYGYIQVIP
jgi:hypothetical protein